MNRNLNEAIFDIAKVEAVMFAFENTYLELDVAPADRARADMATDAFYALWDAIRKVSDDLDRLAGDCRVVDAIYAVNDVRRRVGTLKRRLSRREAGVSRPLCYSCHKICITY